MTCTRRGGVWWITAIAVVVAIHVSCGGSGQAMRTAPASQTNAARSELEGDWMLVGFEAPGGPRKAAGFLRYDRFANISVHAELAGDEPSAQPPRTVVADFTAKANPTDGQFAYTGLQAGVDAGRLTPDAVEMQEWRHYALSGDTLRLSLAGGAATLVFQRSK